MKPSESLNTVSAPMTPDELQACRERVEKATPGPWRVGSVETYHVFVPCSTCIGPERVLLRFNEHFPHGDDAAFIAAARTDVPRLFATVEHAEARAEKAEAALAELRRRVDPDTRVGCQCQWEAGDSPCPVHGENEET